MLPVSVGPTGHGDYLPEKGMVFVAYGSTARYFTLDEFEEYVKLVSLLDRELAKTRLDKLVDFRRRSDPPE